MAGQGPAWCSSKQEGSWLALSDLASEDTTALLSPSIDYKEDVNSHSFEGWDEGLHLLIKRWQSSRRSCGREIFVAIVGKYTLPLGVMFITEGEYWIWEHLLLAYSTSVLSPRCSSDGSKLEFGWIETRGSLTAAPALGPDLKLSSFPFGK